MDNPTILVTGSSGYLGTAVCRSFKGTFNVVGFDLFEPKEPDSVNEYVYTDFTSDESVEHSLGDLLSRHGGEIASVIHLASYHKFSDEEDPLYEKVTLKGTERLLRGLQSFEVAQFVFSSTMLVHAPRDLGEKVDENWTLDPKWPYPRSKEAAEELIKREYGKIPIAILRIAGVYDDYCHSPPISNQIKRIYERDITASVFPGDVTHGQPFLHLDDLLDALHKVVEKRKDLPRETILLLGEEETLSYDEVQRIVGKELHGEDNWVTRQIPKALAKIGAWVEAETPLGEDEPFIQPFMVDIADDHMELDISKAKELLGWTPKRSLRESLPSMAAALKQDPDRWYGEHGFEVSEKK